MHCHEYEPHSDWFSLLERYFTDASNYMADCCKKKLGISWYEFNNIYNVLATIEKVILQCDERDSTLNEGKLFSILEQMAYFANRKILIATNSGRV